MWRPIARIHTQFLLVLKIGYENRLQIAAFLPQVLGEWEKSIEIIARSRTCLLKITYKHIQQG